MRIGVDIDGVCADFIQAYTKIGKHIGVFDTAFPTAEQITWKFKDKEAADATWKALKAVPNWWMTLSCLLFPEEIERLNRTIRKHDVYFITARIRTVGFSAEKQSELWLQSMGINSHHASVIATQAKTKGLLCNALDITHMIEDNADNLTNLRLSGVHAVCRDWPYNQDWDGERVKNLGTFLKRYGR